MKKEVLILLLVVALFLVVNTTVVSPAEGDVNCTENWTCEDWSDCVNETQTRNCTDSNACNTTEDQPDLSQNCTNTTPTSNYTNEELANMTLEKKLEYLNNITDQINDFDTFTSESLEAALSLDDIELDLEDIQLGYDNANSEDDYSLVVDDLSFVDVPVKVYISETGDSLTFYTKEEEIDLDFLEEIGTGTYDYEHEEQYENAIIAWNNNNVYARLTFKEYSATFEDSTDSVLKVFEFEIAEQGTWEETPYFIMLELDDLNFKQDYGEREESGYIYIDLSETKSFTFSTTEDVDFNDLPAFISPDLDDLEVHVDITEFEPDNSKWIYFILILILILVLGFILYYFLEKWYREKYESHLFKNKNQLYNLVIYIQNAKKKGLTDKEIKAKLKKAGWSSEQINYVMRKYAGKRTGMPRLIPGRKKKDEPGKPPRMSSVRK